MLLWKWILSFQLAISGAQRRELIESTTSVWHKSDIFNNAGEKIIEDLRERAKQSDCCYKCKQLGQSVKHIPPPFTNTKLGEWRHGSQGQLSPKITFINGRWRVPRMLLKMMFFIMCLPRRRKTLLVASHPHRDEPNAMPSFNST